MLTRILKRVAKWAELGKMKSFVKQTEIRMELEDSYNELQTCSIRFNVSRPSAGYALLPSPIHIACRSPCICMQATGAKNLRIFGGVIIMNSSR